MLVTLQILFWVSLGGILLTYLGYPLLLLVWRSFPRPHARDESTRPRVSLIVSAFNEAQVIEAKIRNALALDYPSEQLEVIVISDESTDGTDEIVRGFADQGVVLYRQEPRQGKSFGLTQFVPRARGEILVFSDANSIYDAEAIRKLVRHFADPQVGFVVGHQRYVDDDSATADSEGLYWRYETWLKIQESGVNSVVCGDGAIYAARAELFEPLKPDDINDFTLPLKIIAKGYRGVFDAEAFCVEHTAEDFAGEFRRKARIVNRSLRAVTRVPQTLNPFRVGLFSLQLAIHKILRWFVAALLVVVLVSNAWLAWNGPAVYRWLMVAQLACYLLAASYVLPPLRAVRLVYIAYYFCLVNAAAGWGILQFLTGKTFVIWTPQRGKEGQPDVSDTSELSDRADEGVTTSVETTAARNSS